jgi:phosphoglycolate phosphatase
VASDWFERTAPELTSGAVPLIRHAMFPTSSFRGLVEFAPHFAPRANLSHVLFDFDGTLSLIRQGWPEVMLPMFLELLPRRERDSDEALRKLLYDDIMRLNGKQTIYQMIQFVERVQERGGKAHEPLWYKNEYLRRLDQRIRSRLDGLASGSLQRDEFLVAGARPLLETLHRRGLKLYLASGTDEPFVKREAALLDVARYFGEHIYGAKDDYKMFSKKMVIERMLRENQIPGQQLLAFGDGYVEIQNTKDVGGLAVAVASDEAHNGSGQMDQWKRDRLIGVGADIVVPDYQDGEALLDCIFAPPQHA